MKFIVLPQSLVHLHSHLLFEIYFCFDNLNYDKFVCLPLIRPHPWLLVPRWSDCPSLLRLSPRPLLWCMFHHCRVRVLLNLLLRAISTVIRYGFLQTFRLVNATIMYSFLSARHGSDFWWRTIIYSSPFLFIYIWVYVSYCHRRNFLVFT